LDEPCDRGLGRVDTLFFLFGMLSLFCLFNKMLRRGDQKSEIRLLFIYIYWHYINDIYICHPKPRADQTKMRFLKVLSIDSKACWSKQQLSSTSTPAAVAAVASEVLCRFDAGWQASQNFVPCRVIQLTSLVCPKLLQFQ
jgi:hypothetical protein